MSICTLFSDINLYMKFIYCLYFHTIFYGDISLEKLILSLNNKFQIPLHIFYLSHQFYYLYYRLLQVYLQ